MSAKESGSVKCMADFEWGTVGRYLVYVSSSARLVELTDNEVFSFKVGRGGAKGLLARKEATLKRVERNIRNLERWVGSRDDSLDQNELVVLRSMYRLMADQRDTVIEHVNTARCLLRQEQRNSLLSFLEGGHDDELPF